jgi:hypothetical protein
LKSGSATGEVAEKILDACVVLEKDDVPVGEALAESLHKEPNPQQFSMSGTKTPYLFREIPPCYKCRHAGEDEASPRKARSVDGSKDVVRVAPDCAAIPLISEA